MIDSHKSPKIFIFPVLIFFCALLIDINFNKSYFSITFAHVFLLINDANFLNDVIVEVKRSDVIVIILDISIHLFYEEIIEKILKNIKKPKILVFNKIDKISKEFALEKVNKSNFAKNFDEIYYVSALKNKNINNLLDGIVAKLPEGEFDNSLNFETNISKDIFFF